MLVLYVYSFTDFCSCKDRGLVLLVFTATIKSKLVSSKCMFEVANVFFAAATFRAATLTLWQQPSLMGCRLGDNCWRSEGGGKKKKKKRKKERRKEKQTKSKKHPTTQQQQKANKQTQKTTRHGYLKAFVWCFFPNFLPFSWIPWGTWGTTCRRWTTDHLEETGVERESAWRSSSKDE